MRRGLKRQNGQRHTEVGAGLVRIHSHTETLGTLQGHPRSRSQFQHPVIQSLPFF